MKSNKMDVSISLPSNELAERLVLASVIMDGDDRIINNPRFTTEAFYSIKNRTIAEAMIALRDKEVPIDIVSIELQLGAGVASVGGIEGIASLTDSQSSSITDAMIHLATLSKLERKRRIIKSSIELAATAEHAESEELDNAIATHYEECSYNAYGHGSFRTYADGFREVVNEDMDAYSGKIHKFNTGFKTIDKFFGRPKSGEMIVVAARPAMGKTAYALTLANNGLKVGIPTLMFPLEMTLNSLTRRAATSNGLDPSYATRCNTAQYYEGMEKARSILVDTPNFFDDDSNTFTQIESSIRKWIKLDIVKSASLRHVVIDYLQLVHHEMRSRSSSESDRISYMTTRLKSMAVRHGFVLTLLSQLNRECDKRPDKRPVMADLRGSGSIEQDADRIYFLYRPHPYYGDDDRTVDPMECELICRKNRNGPIGKVILDFDGSRALMTEHPDQSKKLYSPKSSSKGLSTGLVSY